jgi:hypothetical protein
MQMLEHFRQRQANVTNLVRRQDASSQTLLKSASGQEFFKHHPQCETVVLMRKGFEQLCYAGMRTSLERGSLTNESVRRPTHNSQL